MTQTTINSISTMPKTRPVYTEGGIRIKTLGRTINDSTGVVAGGLTKIPAGTVISLSGSAGMDYIGGWPFHAVRVMLMTSRQIVMFKKR